MNTDTNMQGAEAPTELSCSECRCSIECCAFCDETGCTVAVCYGCMIVALGESAPQLHRHGG
jgi:hypothetical protein